MRDPGNEVVKKVETICASLPALKSSLHFSGNYLLAVSYHKFVGVALYKSSPFSKGIEWGARLSLNWVSS